MVTNKGQRQINITTINSPLCEKPFHLGILKYIGAKEHKEAGRIEPRGLNRLETAPHTFPHLPS